MESFWEINHKNNNDWWISSDITGINILNYHDIDINISNLKILDIGVGAGNLTIYLSKNNTMISCDISNSALNNIKDYAKTYHTSELKNIEPVDLAICNLVFQHCNDNEITRIINDVNLTDTGIFSFQFAFLRENEEPTNYVKKNIENSTHFFRSLPTMIDIINKSNKCLVNISKPIHFYGNENFSWYIIKIKNKI